MSNSLAFLDPSLPALTTFISFCSSPDPGSIFGFFFFLTVKNKTSVGKCHLPSNMTLIGQAKCPVHITAENVENAVLFLRLGLLSILIFNEALRKRSSKPEEFENAGFSSRCGRKKI